MNIKITRKGNVKVDDVKYKFVPGAGCPACSFNGGHAACMKAPCTPLARSDDGFSQEDGCFQRKQS